MTIDAADFEPFDFLPMSGDSWHSGTAERDKRVKTRKVNTSLPVFSRFAKPVRHYVRHKILMYETVRIERSLRKRPIEPNSPWIGVDFRGTGMEVRTKYVAPRVGKVALSTQTNPQFKGAEPRVVLMAHTEPGSTDVVVTSQNSENMTVFGIHEALQSVRNAREMAYKRNPSGQ